MWWDGVTAFSPRKPGGGTCPRMNLCGHAGSPPTTPEPARAPLALPRGSRVLNTRSAEQDHASQKTLTPGACRTTATGAYRGCTSTFSPKRSSVATAVRSDYGVSGQPGDCPLRRALRDLSRGHRRRPGACALRMERRFPLQAVEVAHACGREREVLFGAG